MSTAATYDPATIEPKWQAHWAAHKTFHVGNPGDADFDSSKPKYYVLDMFPYTSGSGLHVGHPEGYTATDILSRHMRMCGYNVLHPIGWDSFGLPAEQHAISTGVHPRTTTENAIARFRDQLQRFGFSYDWDRELATTDLKYYKWTQWIFLQLFNSWFDPEARGTDEQGRPYLGKARPIDTLTNALIDGSWRIDEDCQIVPASSEDRPRTRDWSQLSEAEQRRVIDQQRLAFLDEVPVNWCPMLGTVLANEEVTNEGRSERGDFPVFRRPLKQWMLRITRYCDRLIADIDHVDWPDAIKAMQRNWVGRSLGAEVDFLLAEPVDGHPEGIPVFTTRPDTLFGATYMVLAPEHPLVRAIIPATGEVRERVLDYLRVSGNKTELDRTAETKEKTGVFTGAYALNPVNDRRIPIWVADYVLMGYGTGAIMAVPAHDERDFEFAKRFELPIVPVVQAPDAWLEEHVDPAAGGAANIAEVLADTEGQVYARAVDAAFVGDTQAINSADFNGLATPEFKKQIVSWLESKERGAGAVNYKLRDWLFSRQRYWGEPFPILHGPQGEVVSLDAADLPLDLPHMEDFKPDSSEDPDAPPRPPLGKAHEWATVTRDGQTWKRELNTMPQWAGSCWYYLRYLDPNNDTAPWDRSSEKYWMHVDQYVGGAEHAVLHLLYARFWHKVLYDLGHVSTVEPFQRLYNQGLIQSFAYKDRRGMTLAVDVVEGRDERFFHKETGEPVDQIVAKMSKALKNVVNPDIILDEFGADTFRLYEMYMGPLDAAKPWNTRDIPGLKRFLNRAWRLVVDPESGALAAAVQDVEPDADVLRSLHKLIAKVGDDIRTFKMNTAIAELIAFTNDLTSRDVRPKSVIEAFVLLLSPFAPHIGEELWQRLGHSKSLAYAPWPVFDPQLAKDDEIEVPVMVNNKLRARIRVAVDADDATRERIALDDAGVQKAIEGTTVRRVIIKPTIVSIVAN